MASAFGADATLRRRLRAGINAAAAGRRAPKRQARPKRKNTRNRNTSKKKKGKDRPVSTELAVANSDARQAPNPRPTAPLALFAPRGEEISTARKTRSPL